MDKKALLKSMTFWGAMIMAVLQTAEATGLLPQGAQNAAVQLLNAAGQALVILGIRKAIKPDIL